MESLLALQKANSNPKLSFYPVDNTDHFTVIAPVSELPAAKILTDTDAKKAIVIRPDEVTARIANQLPPTRTPFPAGNPRADWIEFEYAVYLLNPATKAETLSRISKLITAEFPELTVANTAAATGERQEVRLEFIEDVPASYAPPSGKQLEYNGKGLSQKERDHLLNSTHGIRFFFRHPGSLALKGLRSANRLTAQVSEAMDGLPWDEQTRQVFSLAFWNLNRITKWTESFPESPAHITIHAYRNGENVRAITLGMKKFGLPDVVIDQLIWSNNRSMATL